MCLLRGTIWVLSVIQVSLIFRGCREFSDKNFAPKHMRIVPLGGGGGGGCVRACVCVCVCVCVGRTIW